METTDINTRMNRLLDDVKVLLTLPDDKFSSEEKQKYILQFIDCIVYCSEEEKKRYESLVEQSDHDIVDLEHLYVFKKNEENGGKLFVESVRNVPNKWATLSSDGLNHELTDTLVRRRSQKDLMVVYDALSTKIGLAKNILSHMGVRVYTVGKTNTNRNINKTRNYPNKFPTQNKSEEFIAEPVSAYNELSEKVLG